MTYRIQAYLVGDWNGAREAVGEQDADVDIAVSRSQHQWCVPIGIARYLQVVMSVVDNQFLQTTVLVFALV